MLRILGSSKILCDGLTRRDFLSIGGLGAFGFALSDLLRGQSAHAAGRATSSFGKAKACILLFPYGSPPQHETFDPKPEAPAEIQGEMKAIASCVPGLTICERLPLIARVMDLVTVVRSMSHPYPEHGVAYAVTGMPTYTPALETRPRDPAHWPFIGSVVDYLNERRSHDAIPSVPGTSACPGCSTRKRISVRWLDPMRLFSARHTIRSGQTLRVQARRSLQNTLRTRSGPFTIPMAA